MKKIVFICLILLVLAVMVFKTFTASTGEGGVVSESGQAINLDVQIHQNVPELVQPEVKEPLDIPKESNAISDAGDEDSVDLKALRDQMNKERGIQQQIKLHNLELERTKVQLEQEKALAEMNQLRKTNLGIVRDPNGNGTVALPDAKLVFLSVSEKGREAILTINGTNYTVKEGDKPLETLVVKTINEKGVVIVLNGDKESFLTTNLME